MTKLYNLKLPLERILKNIKINGSCWEWIGSKDQYGYGRIGIKLKRISTHRFIYEYYYGQICPDLEIDHLCRNHACCNPLHLEQVTHQINMQRGHNGMKTHCKRGHEFTPENTYIKKDDSRCCRSCSISQAIERNYKNKEKIKIYNSNYYLKHRSQSN